MLICRVVGNIISTRKVEWLKGIKFALVEPVDGGTSFVAADNLGAGVDERVLVVQGSGARKAFLEPELPVDAAIIGIVDAGTYAT